MEDVKTVHYVTQDPMQNLKLRVTLTRLSAEKPKKRECVDQSSPSPSAAGDGGTQCAASVMQGSRPQPFKVARAFAWQEKVYSRAELAAAQAQMRASQRSGTQYMSPKRSAHFGSQSHIGTDRLLTASPEGSVLFTYVQTDEFCERYETSKEVTTSSWETENHLAKKLITDPRNRQKMLNLHAMFVMADLGDEHTVAGSNEKVLCVIRTHQDGSFDMTPGFSSAGQKYRFEDDRGGIYEYVVEPASQSAAPSLEKLAAKLAVAVAAQAEQLRRQSNRMDHTPPPGPDSNAVRLVLMAELVAAAGFQRDRLYIEWQLHFDPELWVLQHSEQEVLQPGVIQGVTHVSHMVQYPADFSTDTPAVWVAHFAHPIEVEWIARAAPAPKDWPKMLLQVCTYDLWDRVTTEGYGWLALGATCPGSSTQCVDTWKPLGTRRDQQQAYFIGGSEELQDMSFIAEPKGHKGQVLNKYGYKTQTSGTVKVRTHCVLQTGASGGTSPRRAAANRRAATTRQRKELSLAVVLERARSRLQEARGGEVAVREGVVSQRPTVTAQPTDVSVNEGATAQFTLSASGLGPLRYQWFKDSKRLTVATSNSPLLILVDVGAAESGSYHCQVSNKDGAVTSSKALLNITRVGRLQHATALTVGGQDSTAGNSDPASAPPSLSNTLNKRSTVPRTLGSRGGLPYSLRIASGAGGSASGISSGAASPLRVSGAMLSPLARRTPAAAADGDVSSTGAGRASPVRRSYRPAETTTTATTGDGIARQVAPDISSGEPLSQQKQQQLEEPAQPAGLQHGVEAQLESMSLGSHQTSGVSSSIQAADTIVDVVPCGTAGGLSDGPTTSPGVLAGTRRTRVSEQH